MGEILLRIIYLCTIGCSLYTSGWLFLKAGRNRTTWALAVCQLLVIVWCVPLLFAGFLTTTPMKYLAYGISYIGISFIGPAWLEFSFDYCGKRLGRLWRGLLLVVSVFNYAMFLCNESHHLFYRQFSVEQVVYGPVFYFHMIYTYFCVLCGMAAVLREFRRKRVAAAHLTVILLAAAVPLGFNLLYLSGTVRANFDLTPPAFAWSSILMLFAVFRYDFLDINAMAFEQIFASIAEGVVVYNGRGELTYWNRAAENWLGIAKGEQLAGLEEKIERLGFRERTGSAERSVEEAQARAEPVGQDTEEAQAGAESAGEYAEATLADGTRLRMKRYRYQDKNGRTSAGAMVLTDVSEFYRLMEQGRQLEQSARRLAVEQERNRIAQEVHDTTGHTLTMIQSLLRLMKVELAGGASRGGLGDALGSVSGRACDSKKASDQAQAYIEQAQELVTSGIRELRCSINEMRGQRADMTVSEGVRLLAGSVKEIPVVAEFQGEDGPQYTGLSPIVYGVLREAITNCLKYANASQMDVIVSFRETALDLYIFDDGQGCAKIKENNGLRGIRERVTAAGGTVRAMSAEGEGFQIYVSLPVQGA